VKISISKKVLSDMPPQIAAVVSDWKTRHKKKFFTLSNVASFYPGEDAKVEMFNLLTGKSKEQRVAGEWAGVSQLSPTDSVPLPPGCAAVVTGFFLGRPWLTIYQNGDQPDVTALAEANGGEK
jgi:hypothetical protein